MSRNQIVENNVYLVYADGKLHGGTNCWSTAEGMVARLKHEALCFHGPSVCRDGDSVHIVDTGKLDDMLKTRVTRRFI